LLFGVSGALMEFGNNSRLEDAAELLKLYQDLVETSQDLIW